MDDAHRTHSASDASRRSTGVSRSEWPTESAMRWPNRAERESANVLEMIKKLVPGTIEIEPCHMLDTCFEKKGRNCDHIKLLCLTAYSEEKEIIGGISFIFDPRNGIIVQRFNQAGNYFKIFENEGKGFDGLLEKFNNDEVIKEIQKETDMVKKEQKEEKDRQTIEAFKRQIDQIDILATRKNKTGEYSKLDQELIRLVKEKEEKDKKEGKEVKKIKIVDISELDSTIYVLGIPSKNLVKKIDVDAKQIMDVDNRIRFFIFGNSKKYAGLLAISSEYDDIVGNNDYKEEWKNYFVEKYKGLKFLENVHLPKKGTV